uniref:Uncharacterized protein n=1 Tax=Pipistrellus kuhlii TaxID=59472 RepID=A0A7J7XAU0_PIPKU|nr:hypothetical protein mPipKuh1_010596 [Pipistrellus kuhlii]
MLSGIKATSVGIQKRRRMLSGCPEILGDRWSAGGSAYSLRCSHPSQVRPKRKMNDPHASQSSTEWHSSPGPVIKYEGISRAQDTPALTRGGCCPQGTGSPAQSQRDAMALTPEGRRLRNTIQLPARAVGSTPSELALRGEYRWQGPLLCGWAAAHECQVV